MKSLIVTCLVILICGCRNDLLMANKTENVQACLDSLYRKNTHGSLSKSQLVLVKDSHSAGLEHLHFGQNKIVLKEVPASAIKVYFSPKQDMSKRYLKIKYSQVDMDHLNIVIELPNVNTWFTYHLKRNGFDWKIERVITAKS